jgi:hypothetical protein
VSNRQKQGEAEKQLADKQKELAKEVADLALQLVTQMYQARIDALEAEKEKEQERYDAEVANIEAAGYSKEEEEARKRAAAAQTKAAQDKIDEQVKEEKRKAAIANKAAAIIQALINTALAVSAALTIPPPVGTAMAVVNAALGAVQVAAIAAQPIPKYARGRDGGPAEWAIVGDGGRQEVIVGKGGEARVTPAFGTLAWLEQSDVVFPSIPTFEDFVSRTAIPQSAREMMENYTPMNVSVDFSKMVEEQKKSTKELKEAMKNQGEVNLNKAYGMVKTIMAAGNSTKTVVNTMKRS